jgi:hypothetical protein
MSEDQMADNDIRAVRPVDARQARQWFLGMVESGLSMAEMSIRTREERMTSEEHELPDVPFIDDDRQENHAPTHPTEQADRVDTDDGGDVDDMLDERVLGARPHTENMVYPSLRDFVEKLVSHVFAYQQTSSTAIRWIADWWRYPSLVFPLDAMWRSYEHAAHGEGGEMQSWYFQSLQLFNIIFNKDTGLAAKLPSENMQSGKGDPLPLIEPNGLWSQNIIQALNEAPYERSGENVDMIPDDRDTIEETKPTPHHITQQGAE